CQRAAESLGLLGRKHSSKPQPPASGVVQPVGERKRIKSFQRKQFGDRRQFRLGGVNLVLRTVFDLVNPDRPRQRLAVQILFHRNSQLFSQQFGIFLRRFSIISPQNSRKSPPPSPQSEKKFSLRVPNTPPKIMRDPPPCSLRN